MNTKLTIITINYNNLLGLQKTVESVINQTWQEFEYIVIDGASTDGSAAYIESQNQHIDYWVSEPDKGIYNAMNKGIAKATGEYLLFLNSGDHFFNDSVIQENHDKIANYDLIYCDLEVIGKTETFIKKYPEKLSFSYFMKDTLPHPATFIKTALFDKVGLYDETFKIVSDWKFFIESVCKFNSSYKRIDVILSTFYLDGISAHSDYFSEREKVLKDQFAFFIEDTQELNYLRAIVRNLRKSRKIKWLIKLGLLNKF